MPNSQVVFQSFKTIEVVDVEATIEIAEDIIRLKRGQSKTVPFTYFPGDPPAETFGMEFYLTEADAEAGENRLTHDLPTYTLSPPNPIPIVVEDLEGLVSFYVPFNWSYTTIYAKLLLCQEGVRRRIPISEKITEDITRSRQRVRRNVYSNWRRR